MQRYFEAHRAVLEGALTAAARRTYWSAAPETPSGKLYGESAKADAEAAFKAQLVNQSAAFSDYHVTGANPSGNACLTDTAFVASRFRVAGVRRPAAV